MSRAAAASEADETRGEGPKDKDDKGTDDWGDLLGDHDVTPPSVPGPPVPGQPGAGPPVAGQAGAFFLCWR